MPHSSRRRRPQAILTAEALEDYVPPRFLQLADVAEMLSISTRQAYALVQTGELPAIQVGGRRQWRIEATELEAYIQRMYAQTRARIESRPETEAAESDADEADAEETFES